MIVWIKSHLIWLVIGVIAVLEKGDRGRVIHIRYSKDFMFYKIKLDDGRMGYVMYGDKFKVVKKDKK